MAQAESAGRSWRKPRAPREPRSGGVRRLAALLANYQSGGLLIALLVMGAIFTSMSKNFLTHRNLTVILLQVSIVGLVAIPQAMLVLSGYVDLSVGSVAVLAVAMFGQMAHESGRPRWFRPQVPSSLRWHGWPNRGNSRMSSF